MALVPHHRLEGAIVISMTITVAPKNEDSQEREFRPTLPVLSLEQRCGMMVRDMYLTLEAFGAQLDLKVRSCSKSCPPISKASPNRMSAQTVRVCAYHRWTTYLMSYLNTNKANWSRDKRVWERSPTVELLRWFGATEMKPLTPFRPWFIFSHTIW